MKLIILAAGFGIRLRKIVGSLPKPLLKIGELSLIERLLMNFKSAGIDDVLILVGYEGKKIKDQLKDSFKNEMQIKIIQAEGYEAGPLYTFLNARKLMKNENFIVCPADVHLDPGLIKEFLKHQEKNNNLLAVDENLIHPNAAKVFIKLLETENNLEIGCVLGIHHPILPDYEKIRRAIPLLACDHFMFDHALQAKKMGKNRLVDALNLAIAQEFRLYSILLNGYMWYDVDSIEDFEKLVAELNTKKRRIKNHF
ncbi:MAG: sugar phosphate nucleotidyltransferase [Promethearchaeota archaeon]